MKPTSVKQCLASPPLLSIDPLDRQNMLCGNTIQDALHFAISAGLVRDLKLGMVLQATLQSEQFMGLNSVKASRVACFTLSGLVELHDLCVEVQSTLGASIGTL